MKQVIVRIRDCRPTYTKTIARYYFYSVYSYQYDVMDCVKTLLPGQEIYIKIGNLYSKYISYEDVDEACSINNSLIVYDDEWETFEDALYGQLLEDYNVNYYMKKYLPLE